MSLQGKRIVVTGAASGIGAASAKLLREKGAYVIGVDRNDASAYCDEYVKVDLANEESIQAAAAQIGGHIDGICNIAGVPPSQRDWSATVHRGDDPQYERRWHGHEHVFSCWLWMDKKR